MKDIQRYTDPEARKKYRREYMRGYMKQYRRTCKKEGRDYWGNLSQRLRIAAINALGGPICSNCGCDELKILEVNHKKTGQRKNWVIPNERIKTLRAIATNRTDKTKFNVLCRVCNALHYVFNTLGIEGHKVLWVSEKKA